MAVSRSSIDRGYIKSKYILADPSLLLRISVQQQQNIMPLSSYKVYLWPDESAFDFWLTNGSIVCSLLIDEYDTKRKMANILDAFRLPYNQHYLEKGDK